MQSRAIPDRLADYDRSLDLYMAFASKLEGLLAELLRARNVNIHSVSSRVKSRQSFETKLHRMDEWETDIRQVTDFVGLRVITYFAEDVDAASRVVADNFDVDPVRSVDKRTVHDPDRFGYSSLHLVVTMPRSRTRLPEFSRFRQLRAEIQIRTVLQHAWAEIEHDLGYKNRLGVPAAIRRKLSRVSGLLEIADEEFSYIRHHIAQHQRRLRHEIASNPAAVGIDRDPLVLFFETDPAAANVEQGLRSILGANGLVDPDPHFLAADLEWLRDSGLATVGDLRIVYTGARKDILAFACKWFRSQGPTSVQRSFTLSRTSVEGTS